MNYNQRRCGTCEYAKVNCRDEPCGGCFFGEGKPNWTPKGSVIPTPTSVDVDHHHVEIVTDDKGFAAGMALAAKPLPENPKAIHGRSKPTLALIPGGAQIPMARVFELGASKYGAFNWRKDPVEAETYVSAAQRHLLSWFDGEDIDPESGQPHIAHVACCMAILLDAASCGKLIDNRPHKGTSADLIRALTKPLETIA